MPIKTVSATGRIMEYYQTGDRPVLILCSDGNHYICKYKEPAYSANKLANELIGSLFAKEWGIATPYISLVQNDSIIWDNSKLSHDPIAPLLGSRKMDNVSDLNEINSAQVPVKSNLLSQLLKIALFDFWMANDDRTSNNYNLLYDIKQEQLVSIDYGGIFNTGVLDRPLYQLNDCDSILSSNLFDSLKQASNNNQIQYLDFESFIDKSSEQVSFIISTLPGEWNVDSLSLKKKLDELFSKEWIEMTWDNYQEISHRLII